MSASRDRMPCSTPGFRSSGSIREAAPPGCCGAIGPQAARAALLFGMQFDAVAAERHGLVLKIADDPVAAALELAAGRRRRRDVVLATKASMRATAIPASSTAPIMSKPKNIELGPQAASIESPEFAPGCEHFGPAVVEHVFDRA